MTNPVSNPMTRCCHDPSAQHPSRRLHHNHEPDGGRERGLHPHRSALHRGLHRPQRAHGIKRPQRRLACAIGARDVPAPETGLVRVSFYGWPKIDLFMAAWKQAGFRIGGHFVFPKRYASRTAFVGYQHECAYLLIKGNPAFPAQPLPDVLPWIYTGNHHHPTQKSVRILQPLIETFSRPGDLVLDPFAGSGSTCVAAQRAGRRSIGIDLDAAHCATARTRLARYGPGS